MLLAWRTIGVIQLSEQWQLTNVSTGNLYRITHTIDGNPSGTLRAAIGQEAESVIFDRRLIGYKSGALEGQLFIKPSGIENRKLALQRLDKDAVSWFVKIEELIDLATSLPLPISDIDGLQDALDGKVGNADLEASEQSLLAQINQKSPIEHNHEIADIDGLLELLQSVQPINSVVTSQLPPNDPFTGLIWHEVTSAGEIVESWIYASDLWKSLTTYTFQYFAGSNSISSGVAYAIPLKAGFDYYFLNFQTYILYSSSSPIDSTTNHWRVLWGMQQAGINVANSQAIPYSENALSVDRPLNLLHSPIAGERLLCMFNKTGSPPNARLASIIWYKLVKR